MFGNTMAGVNNVTVDYSHGECQKAETDGIKHSIPAIRESYEGVVVRVRHLLMATRKAQPQ